MLENANTAVIRRWFEEVWNQGRLETIDELLAPDGVAHDLGGPGATTRGVAAFREAAKHLHSAFGEMHLVVEDIFGVDDRVAVRLTLTARHSGPLGDLEPTGNMVKVPVMCMVRLKDGKLIEGYNSWDVAACLRAANAPATQSTLF